MKLFAPGATYREDPFDSKPLAGLREIRDYWAAVPKYQKSISFNYGPTFHLADSKVWGSEWKATYTKIETRERIRLRGVLFCELSGQKIRRFWEYWHIRGGKPSFGASALKEKGVHKSLR